MVGGEKVDVRLPGKRNSNSHGARPVHLIITMIKLIRTSRLSITRWEGSDHSARLGEGIVDNVGRLHQPREHVVHIYIYIYIYI